MRGKRNCLAIGLLWLTSVSEDCSAQGTLYDAAGDEILDYLGLAVGAAGDINADGHADFMFSSLLDGISVHSGFDSSLLYQLRGADPYGALGFSLAPAGDVNGDGFVDLVAGGPWASIFGFRAGNVVVFSGRNGAVLHSIVGAWAGQWLGESVSGVGDVDADGFDDIIAGGAGDSGVGPGTDTRGSVMVYSGRSGADIYILQPEIGNGSMGRSVSAAGDIDRDGYQDFALVRSWAGLPESMGHFGTVIHSGRNGRVLRTMIDGLVTGPRSNQLVAPGDLNHDGVLDLLVGGAIAAGMGRTVVYSGVNGEVLWKLQEDHDWMSLGAAVGAAGDVDGDGTLDLIVGAPGTMRPERDRAGFARVYSGRSFEELFTIPSPFGHHTFGSSVSGAGDVNADGRADLIVGAPFGPEPGGELGSIAVFSATCGPIASFGAGCIGGGPFAPLLDGLGCPTPGGTLRAELTGGPSGALGLLLIGNATAPIPFRGCDRRVDPVFGLLPVQLSSGSAGGRYRMSVKLPMDVPFGPVTVQVFLQDGAAPAGVSASNAVVYAVL